MTSPAYLPIPPNTAIVVAAGVFLCLWAVSMLLTWAVTRRALDLIEKRPPHR
jgi:hypothetical protein